MICYVLKELTMTGWLPEVGFLRVGMSRHRHEHAAWRCLPIADTPARTKVRPTSSGLTLAN